MRWFMVLFIFSQYVPQFAHSQYCREGRYPMPVISSEARTKMEKHLEEARIQWENSPNDKEALIWYGRRLAYLGLYREAVDVFSKGTLLWPGDARFLRHRGHRYITLRCNREAIADLAKANDLMKNKPDEIEPDGIPNTANIPLSTLKTNITYHLGLAYFLDGDLELAEHSWREGLTFSTNPDMFVATSYWLYVTLRLAGKEEKARELLNQVSPDLQLIENIDYYNILLLYKGKHSAETLLKKLSDSNGSLSNATIGFAMGLFYHISHQEEKAQEFFGKVLKTNQWSSFGYIGAEKYIK